MAKASILKNTFYLTMASIGQKLIAFVYFTMIANTVGVEDTGAYFLALSLTTIFSVVADWGLTPVMIREIAKEPTKAIRIIRSVLGLKIPLILLGGVGAVTLSTLLGYDTQIIGLVTIATLVLAADGISLAFFGVLRGLQNLRYESLGIFIGQILTASFGVFFLLTNQKLEILIIALLIGSLWNAIYSGSRVAKHLGKEALRPSFNKERARILLKLSFAFALAATFVKVYSYVDTILLSKFIGNEAVGVYAIAYKITYAFQFLPLAFVGALYPAMSELVKHDRSKLVKVFQNAIWYMAILATPIVFGIMSIADKLIPALYPIGYGGSILPLQILIFVLLFIFLDFPVGSLLNAANRQATKTTILGITMIINIIANTIMIPRLGVIGAPISAVISFLFLFSAGIYFVPQIINYRFSNLIGLVSPILLSGILMSATVILMKPYLHFVLLIVLGAVVYIAFLFLFKAVTVEHLRQARDLLKPKTII